MESEGGGGVATAITPRRLSSQHSTLRESFLASDLAEINNTSITNSNAHYNINRTNNDNNDNNTSNSSNNQRPVSTLTLGAVLNCDKKSPPPSNIVVRTLLEIIRNDETLNNGSSPRSQLAGRKPWKSFKERLKLRRASISHSSNVNLNRYPNSQGSTSVMDTVPSDDVASREVDSGGSPRTGGSFRLSAALAAERDETRRRLSRELIEVNRVEEGEEGNNSNSPENQPLRMSLMDLLEETDRQAGVSGPLYHLDDDVDVADVDEGKAKVEDEVEECSDGKSEHSCCVCMVRHKGAAFIPCGHTFCRLCSRELWVQRGNCPLCNNLILEVLDIF